MRRVVAATERRVAQFRHRRLLAKMAGPRLLRAFAEAYDDPVFVEIGANDGQNQDHLRPFVLAGHWRGVLVEPTPYVFDRLKLNYAGFDSVALANVAVADRDGRRTFYYLAQAPDEDRATLPDWYDALGSFSREAVLRHADRIPDIEQRLVQREVPCLTFTSLCAAYGLVHVDLLVIDTEGYDWEIIRSLDFSQYRPRLIVYEHYHLSAADRARARQHLRDQGYELMEEGFDTFCLDPRKQDGLAAAWRRLRPAVPGLSKHDELQALSRSSATLLLDGDPPGVIDPVE